jgi:hypothetical protein
MRIQSAIALIFSIALFVAPGANAQFGKLLGGDKKEDKKEEPSSKSPFGGLLGGSEDEEPEFVLVTAAEWLAKSEDDQAAYIAEVRETYPQDPPDRQS